MPKLEKTMFREYDLRGRESDEELNDTSIYHISKEFAVMLKENNYLKDDMKNLFYRVKIQKKFKILVNTAKGKAGILTPKLLRRAGCEVVEHFTNIDPTYPNYTANPDGTVMMEDTGKQTVANH